MVRRLLARKETEFLRSRSNRLRSRDVGGGGGGRARERKKKRAKRGKREIWNMSTEMQIFVRKLITRINSSQNVQTVCRTGRFYLFSRRQTESVAPFGRSSQRRVGMCVVARAHAYTVCTRTKPRPLPSPVRVLRRIGIKFTRHPDILFRPTDCKRIL